MRNIWRNLTVTQQILGNIRRKFVGNIFCRRFLRSRGKCLGTFENGLLVFRENLQTFWGILKESLEILEKSRKILNILSHFSENFGKIKKKSWISQKKIWKIRILQEKRKKDKVISRRESEMVKTILENTAGIFRENFIVILWECWINFGNFGDTSRVHKKIPWKYFTLITQTGVSMIHWRYIQGCKIRTKGPLEATLGVIKKLTRCLVVTHMRSAWLVCMGGCIIDLFGWRIDIRTNVQLTCYKADL